MSKFIAITLILLVCSMTLGVEADDQKREANLKKREIDPGQGEKFKVKRKAYSSENGKDYWIIK